MSALENNISTSYTTSIDSNNNYKLALKDIVEGLFYKAPLWFYLGLTDTRRRYQRTVIGPFWTTLSLGLFIGCMGVLLSTAWQTPVKDFLPYFCSGYICWMIMQSTLSEGCTTFTAPGTYVKQISMPYTMYSSLLIWRNIIVLLHHLVILGLVLIYSKHPLNMNCLYFIPGIIIVFLTSVWVATLLGMACARFRDVQQVIVSVLQLAMFITPIMWKPEQLGNRGILAADLNPLFHYISIIRLPLIGQAPSTSNWVCSICISIVGGMFTYYLLAKNYRRIVFWL